MTMKPEGRVRILIDDGTRSLILTQEYKEANTVQIVDDMGYAHQLVAELYQKQKEEHGKIVQRYFFSPE